jgi:hypothetical protein
MLIAPYPKLIALSFSVIRTYSITTAYVSSLNIELGVILREYSEGDNSKDP